VTAVTPESIMKVAMGFMAAKHLFVASEVGLFDALAAGPATIEELASRTGVPSRRSTDRFLPFVRFATNGRR
jgi:Dimerisation domain